jgi:hypothetical protein
MNSPASGLRKYGASIFLTHITVPRTRAALRTCSVSSPRLGSAFTGSESGAESPTGSLIKRDVRFFRRPPPFLQRDATVRQNQKRDFQGAAVVRAGRRQPASGALRSRLTIRDSMCAEYPLQLLIGSASMAGIGCTPRPYLITFHPGLISVVAFQTFAREHKKA